MFHDRDVIPYVFERETRGAFSRSKIDNKMIKPNKTKHTMHFTPRIHDRQYLFANPAHVS